MFQQFLAQRDLVSWPLLALVVFFLTFIGVLLYVVIGLRTRRETVDRLALLPLESDERPLEEGGRNE